METLQEALSPTEIETVRRALKAAVEGSFFPDWEFGIIVGVDRKTVQRVQEAWPRQTVDKVDFVCAVVGSLNNLVGYPHGREDELAVYVPEGRTAIEQALRRLTSLGL